MKFLNIKNIVSVALMSMIVGATSCVNDLNTVPLDKDELVAAVVYGSELDAYTQSLAKIHAGMIVAGNAGGDGNVDVAGVDGGSQASFLRVLFMMQEITSDIAHCNWTDPGVPDMNSLSWSASNPWFKGSYYRLYYQINLANAFLRETTADKLSERGCSDAVVAEVNTYRAEARFLRALMYQYALDFYRNVPFVDENSSIGNVHPSQIMANDLFTYIETEMKAVETEMLEPIVGYNSTDYGRTHKAAVWAALSRLYLNAEVYIGENKYTECITYADKVINAGYELEPVYGNMFKADNHKSKEMIMPLRYEGDQTLTWGGMTFFLCMGSSSFQEATNAVGAWQGIRAKSTFVNIFDREDDKANDSRFAMVRVDDTTSPEITNEAQFLNNGTPIAKYYNVNSDGSLPGSNQAFIDFPLFRLGEMYLTIAEAVVRGGSGATRADALKYVNDLRKRAYTDDTNAEITDAELTLDFILDERARELFYEAHRRTDLIRFGKYTTGYSWPWKGGVAGGRDVSEIYEVFPIPSDDIGANQNLTQNAGY